MVRIVGVNGRATHGVGNIDLLLDVLAERGYEVVDVRLPLRRISTFWGARHDGYLIAEQSISGCESHQADILVAHSFGCERSWWAHRVREYKAIFAIAPAMSQYREWRVPERVYCYHSPGDTTVRLSSWVPFHPYGRAGVDGFRQLDPIGHNYQVSSDHGRYFKGDLLTQLVRHIDLVARS